MNLPELLFELSFLSDFVVVLVFPTGCDCNDACGLTVLSATSLLGWLSCTQKKNRVDLNYACGWDRKLSSYFVTKYSCFILYCCYASKYEIWTSNLHMIPNFFLIRKTLHTSPLLFPSLPWGLRFLWFVKSWRRSSPHSSSVSGRVFPVDFFFNLNDNV